MHNPTDRIAHTTVFVTPVMVDPCSSFPQGVVARCSYILLLLLEENHYRDILGALPSTDRTAHTKAFDIIYQAVRCSSMVEHPLMVQWVVGSITHNRAIFIPASVQLVHQRLWYVLFCLWDKKKSLAANTKE